MSLKRFGISMEEELLKEFDRFIKKKGYKNRSEAIRDLLRDRLVDEDWEGRGEVMGAILFVYDHSKRDLANKIISMGHSLAHNAIFSFHVHLDAKHCLEIFIVRGKTDAVRDIANRIQSTKGVKLVRLVKILGRKVP